MRPYKRRVFSFFITKSYAHPINRIVERIIIGKIVPLFERSRGNEEE